MAEYRSDHASQLQESPEVSEWIKALEEGDLDTAASSSLWSRLKTAGLIEMDEHRPPLPDSGCFPVKVIASRLFDAFQSENGPRTNYAFTTVKICLRRVPVQGSPEIPSGWEDVALIDTELFELPHGTTLEPEPGTLDDMEKIHVVYLAGVIGGEFLFKPVYIGVGTGEAYGVGPAHRDTKGRYRFYRYDIKDNYQLEYVRATEGPESEQQNVSEVPEAPPIQEQRARVLLGRGRDDTGFMCLSDPSVAKAENEILKDTPLSVLVTKVVTLEKVHKNLRERRAGTSFAPDDVRAALKHAWAIYRWFYAAWLHPKRLTDAEGFEMYYRQLPAWRREQYAIYRIRPELLGLSPADSLGNPLPIPRVVADQDLRSRLEQNVPGALERIERWLHDRLVEDLYDFGSHPELRLCIAIALWMRLADTGIWASALKAAYEEELHRIDFGVDAICG